MKAKFEIIGPFRKDYTGPLVVVVGDKITLVNVLFIAFEHAFAQVGDVAEPVSVKLSDIFCAEKVIENVEGWVNVYKTRIGAIHPTKEEAEKERGMFYGYVRTAYLCESED